MATTYYLRTGSSGSWATSANWSTVSPASSTNTGTSPVAGDTAYMESTSGSLTLSTSPACATLNMTGYGSSGSTFAFGTSHTLTITAGAILEGAFSGTTSTIVIQGG